MFYLKPSKYFKIELIFFVIYFYVFRFLTDFEYNFWEQNKTGISWFSVEHNLVFGTTSAIAFWFFYLIVKRYLIDKKLIKLVLLIILFLICYSLYLKGCYYVFGHLDLLSEEMRKSSLRNFHFKSIGYSLAYLFGEFLAISALAYFIHADQQSEQMRQIKEQQLISELTYLKAQLQPHFFFNTLNNIYSLALTQSKETAPLVAKLAEMMRYMLYKSDEKLVPLHEEIEFIRNCVAVEKIRYRDALTINFDEQGINSDHEIGPLLLLPFVENAFKHGIEEEIATGFVDIVIIQVNDELTLDIRNSIAATETNRKGGIGLQNVRKRLEILYPNHVLTIKHDDKNYHVNLTLWLK